MSKKLSNSLRRTEPRPNVAADRGYVWRCPHCAAILHCVPDGDPPSEVNWVCSSCKSTMRVWFP